MDLLLTILKLSGIIVSGALGILGTVTETRSKQTGQLTSWGKWALSLTIAGLATALLAQIAEDIKGQRDSRIAQSNTSRQLKEADKSLKYLERLATRFDTMSFSVTYQLDPTNSFFEPLWEFIDHFTGRNLPPLPAGGVVSFPGVPPVSSSASHTAFHSFLRNQHPSQHSAEESTATNTDVDSGNYVIYRYDPDAAKKGKDPVELFSVGAKGAGGLEFTLPQKSEFFKLAEIKTPHPGEFDELLDFLNSPCLSIALYAPQNTILKTPDFYVLTTNLMEPPKLTYYSDVEKLTITWVFSCPKSNWKQPIGPLAMPDLANASLCHSLLNEPSQIYRHILPVGSVFMLNQNNIQLHDFTRILKPDAITNQITYDYNYLKDAFANGTTQGLSEHGDYSIVWDDLYKSSFPDEEQMGKILGNELPSEK